MRRGEAGFSLLEVLVAFAILALSLGVLMDIFGGGLNNLDQSASYTRAVLVAQSRLAEFGATTPLRPGHDEGSIDQTYHWRADVTELQRSAFGAALYGIHLEVLWGSESRPRKVTLDTMRIGPAS